jgi:hypothetical protein
MLDRRCNIGDRPRFGTPRQRTRRDPNACEVAFSVESPPGSGRPSKLPKIPFPGNHFSPRPGRCIEIAEVVPRFERSAAKRTFHYRRKRGANISTDEKLPMSFFILRHHEVDFPSVSENACLHSAEACSEIMAACVRDARPLRRGKGSTLLKTMSRSCAH